MPNRPSTPEPQGLPVRVGASATVAVLAATAASVVVKSLGLLGLIELDTIAWSLAARVVFPALAFVGTFAIVFWWFGREIESPLITTEMSDEEIAEAIRNS